VGEDPLAIRYGERILSGSFSDPPGILFFSRPLSCKRSTVRDSDSPQGNHGLLPGPGPEPPDRPKQLGLAHAPLDSPRQIDCRAALRCAGTPQVLAAAHALRRGLLTRGRHRLASHWHGPDRPLPTEMHFLAAAAA
jgi:hypothetical protein